MRWKWRQGTGTYVFLQAFDRLKRRSRRAGGAESSTARFAWRGLLRATNPELSLASSVSVLVRCECDEESCRTCYSEVCLEILSMDMIFFRAAWSSFMHTVLSCEIAIDSTNKWRTLTKEHRQGLELNE
jgi:hypothetical protein